MCGIAGFVNPEGQPADRSIAERMIQTLTHRGPDGWGVKIAGRAALGHRRLSIIDLAGGAQPIGNEDESIWITYNGELYNELELRRGLRQRGHLYRTNSDTESIVHLYEELGDSFPQSLNGMYACAIWDQPREALVLARDRMGQKPLYYATTPSGVFVFGSEPKAVLAHPDVARALDHSGLARYLFYEYLPAPHGIWAGVSKLSRGTMLLWSGGRQRLIPTWSPDPRPDLAQSATAADRRRIVHEFHDLLVNAVDRHTRSDVPLGVFLSGGIDSSAVAAALTERIEPARIQTFSIGFDDPSFDESRFARIVAEHLGTTHHERRFLAQDALDLLPEIARWLDEPFGDASILPTHLLSRFARESVTVALGGDGADELLAGYPTFLAERLASHYRRFPRTAQGWASWAARQLPVDHGNLSFDFKLKQFLRGANMPAAVAHQRWLGSFSGAEIRELLIDAPGLDVEAEHEERAGKLAVGADPLSRSLALYQDTYLPEDILTKVDRASMACGLEVRAPFLDTELVDMIQRLPANLKLRGRRGKWILKQAIGGRLPDAIARRSKKGFGIPVGRWLRGPLGGLVDDLLGAEPLRRQGLFRPRFVARLVDEHRAGVVDHRKPLWTLLMFQLWHRHWLEGL